TVMPYVFTFVPQIESIEFKSKINKKYTFSRIQDFSGCNYEEVADKIVKYQKRVYSAKVGNTQVAIEITNQEINHILDIPILFCAYPMLGTENFPFPCVINNPNFIPKTERNGIELSSNDTTNRIFIEEAVLAYSELLKMLCDEKIDAIYNICYLRQTIFEGNTQEWFKKSVSDKIKDCILNNEVVLTSSNKREKLAKVYIPYPENDESFEEYFSICEKTSWQIPIKKEAHKWYSLLNFSIFTNEKFDVKKLVEEINDKEKKSFTESLREGESEVKWISQLLKYILDFDLKILLEKHPLIPVKNLKYKTSKQEIFWDNEIPIDLKEIYGLLNDDSYDSILIHQEVEHLGERLWPLDKKKSDCDISEAIDQSFKNVTSDRISPTFISALQKLFSWTDKMNEDELTDLFPIFSANKAKLMLDTLGSDHERNLAFNILKSDKREQLSKLALSEINKNELEAMIKNREAIKRFLEWKNDIVNDTENASDELGDIGESYVYNLLMSKYSNIPGYKVEWVAKTRNEPNYDFEVTKNGIKWLFKKKKDFNV
ncbi:MAG: hypothetical protein K2Q22_06790, partial [Cytophagales bacterium]|nr:hypothetical protein [Cytophagales bacterium]